jgi:hypothetical protein
VKRSPWIVVIGTALLAAAPARPCSLCTPQGQAATYREDAAG